MTTATTSLPYVSVCELVQPALDQNLFYCFMHRQSRIVFIVFVAAMAYQTFSVVFIHFHNFFCSLNRCTHIIQGQYSPNHFHWYKTEDIINRGGGNILIRVYNSLPDESIDKESDVTVHCDGRTYTVPAGTQVKLTPGESIHIQQYMYHDFEVEPGTGAVLLGEVSQCNDDNTDNRFNPPVGRFPKIEEDEAPYRLLCNEYPAAKD